MLTQTLTLATLALGVAAQSSGSITASATRSDSVDAQTTISGLVGTFTTGFAASVVSANPCETTLAMACTDEDSYLCRTELTLSVTQGPSNYEIQYSTATGGGELTISQSCDLRGPVSSASEMVCTASFMVSVGGTSTASKLTETLTRSDEFNYAQIPITAGAEKLPSESASCTSTNSGSGAAPTG